jgi:hypothetical protein
MRACWKGKSKKAKGKSEEKETSDGYQVPVKEEPILFL